LAKKATLIWFTLFIASTSCFNNQSAPTGGGTGRIDTPAGMVEHLQQQNLPPLESAEVWDNDYGPGLRLTTQHYEVFTTLIDPLMLSQIPGFVESAYRGYNGQLPKAIETRTKFPVYLFSTRRQWEDFTDSFAGRRAPMYRKIKAGAYCLNGACVAYNIGRERTFSVLGHEGWHQFNSRHFALRLPSWLDEGIAMLFEVSRYEQGMFYFEPSKNLYRLGQLKRMLMRDRVIPLSKLVSMNPGEVLSTERAETLMAFYSQAYALVRFLREEDYGKRLDDYHRLLLEGLNGDWPLTEAERKITADRNISLTADWNRTIGPKLFAHYIGDDFDQIEKEYLAFCKKTVYHVRLK
jgi:hypothetical protein